MEILIVMIAVDLSIDESEEEEELPQTQSSCGVQTHPSGLFILQEKK